MLAGIVARVDCIEDRALLQHGGMGKLLARIVAAPPPRWLALPPANAQVVTLKSRGVPRSRAGRAHAGFYVWRCGLTRKLPDWQSWSYQLAGAGH
jgi:hypothetical protein